MIYLVIVLAMMLVLGPVLWLKPSAAQKRQTALRLRARALGLDVRLSDLPQVRRARVRQEQQRQGVVYRLLVLDRRAVVGVEYLLVRENAEASWESESEQALPPNLQAALDRVAAAVPDGVAGIEIAPQGPAVYWDERGDEQTVAELAAQLQSLRDAMAVKRE